MHIFVRTLRGNLIEIEVTQYTSIKELKEKIASIETIEVNDIHLFHDDKPLLSDDATLNDANIPHHRYHLQICAH